MDRINKFINKNIEKILIIFLSLQPIIDVCTGISMMVFHNSFILGLGIRLLFLIFMCYYLFISGKNLRKYLFLVILYIILFIINILISKGYNALGYELKSLIKVFYFPLLLSSFFILFKNNKISINNKIFIKLFLIYMFFVIVPNILNIGFRSYEVTKSGSIGFFYTANEIGAIMSILMPILFNEIFKFKNKYINIVTLLLTLYLYLTIGTKAPLILFFVLIIYYIYKYMKKQVVEKKYKSITIISILCVIGMTCLIILLPKTNFYKNIKVHLEFLEIKHISDIYKDTKIIDHLIFSQRLTFWNNTHNIYIDSSLFEKMTGIGYINNYSTDNTSMKMVEMDFVDIFYRHGVVGFIIYMLPICLIIMRILKDKVNKINISYLFSIIFALLLTLLTGHVITAPSVSIFVALIIVLLYNDCKGVKKYD